MVSKTTSSIAWLGDRKFIAKLLGICFLRGVPEDVVVGIGEGVKGGCGGKEGLELTDSDG